MTPLCKNHPSSSESNSYCGLTYHSKFKQEWDEYIDLLNMYKHDERLISKFRDLWMEWITLLHQQQYEKRGNFRREMIIFFRIQTNVWLYTNRVNISWPVIIHFIWPSVIEQNSSTPMSLDFEVTCVNTTKVNHWLK